MSDMTTGERVGSDEAIGRESATIERRGFLKGAAALGAGVLGTVSLGLLDGCAPRDPAAPKQGSSAASGTTTTGALDAAQAQNKWAFEIPPDPISDSQIAETVEGYDLVVVGAGTSGLITAVSAAESGLKVVVVSASKGPVARGGSNNAVFCKAMERDGFERLTPFMFQKEAFYAGNQVDQRKWYKHYNNSEEAMNLTIDLMEKAGYRVKVEKGTPGDPNGLFYETCSVGWDLGEGMEPDPNMVLATGMMQPLLVGELARRLTDDLNGRIDFETKGEQLVRDDGGAGRVSAVICSKKDGSFARYPAAKAVVLATGDFSANRDMMFKYAPHYAPHMAETLFDQETNYDTGFSYGGLYKGDGQRMGLWIGAGWQKIFPNCVMGGFFGPGPRNLYSNFLGLLVNRNGERFMNEDCLSPVAGMNNYGQPGKAVFALWDAGYARHETVSGSWNNDSTIEGDAESIYQAVIASWDEAAAGAAAGSPPMVKGDTIEDVIAQLGLPSETADTVKRYNELASKGSDSDFYKNPTHLHAIESGPFYGQASGSYLVFLTVLGGLNTDANMRVCGDDDNPIPGLYNVGTMVGDMFATNYSFMIEGANYGANCITFGYLTGKYIAKNE